ncbi:MAG TPA: M23 family metallopeptidase [Candidatus Binataceae bacterium]|nr:M23 family metallopeptidase [Candidatus Binataceae bacterium]
MAEKRFLRFGAMAVLGLVLGAMLIVAGCSSSTPKRYSGSSQGSYTVRRGDTLHHIAEQYGVSVSSLMAANGITNPHDLQVGEVLSIPGSYASLGSGSYEDYSSEHPTRIFAWPVDRGVISSGFGIRNGAMHEGVDIAAPVGTPVKAAEAGSVIYSGRLRGYGNVIIVRHDEHYVTVYAHNSANLVREGESVSRGQAIGYIGDSGRTTGANLHFEVRRDNTARNPLAYLPRADETAGISFARNTGS